MLEQRNLSLIVNIIQVSIKTLDSENNVLFDFSEVYQTFSKGSLKVRDKPKNSGITYDIQLNLFYPGISSNSFINFHELIHRKFIVLVKTNDNNIYRLGTEEIPLKLSTSFSTPTGTNLIFKTTTIIPLEYIGSSTISASEIIDGFEYDLNIDL